MGCCGSMEFMDKKKTLLKTLMDYAVVFLGCFLLGVGVGLFTHSNLGTDCMTVLLTGTYQRLGVTLGQMNMFVCGSQILIALGLDRKTVSIATILGIFGVATGIDWFFSLGLSEVSAVSSWLFLVAGNLLYAFGIAVSQLPQCGYSSYDAMIFSFMKHIPSATYPKVLWVWSAIYILIGWSLGGVVGVGTILITLTTGPLVVYFLGVLKKYSKRYGA